MTSGPSDTLRRHLEETVRGWLGLPASSSVPVPGLPDHLARLLLRTEEYERSHRDQWGCWEFGFGESFRRGRLLDPEIDRWVAEQRRTLSASVELEPLWPDGHAFAVCLTHDVDLVSGASTPRQVARSMRAGLSGRPPGPAEPVVRLARPLVRGLRSARAGISRAPHAAMLERCLDIELEHDVRASYLVTVYPADPCRYDCLYDGADLCTFRGRRTRIADVLRETAAAGFDVGLHGSYESALRPGLLEQERASLARSTGLEPTTTRQHFLHWDIRVTPRLQEEAGLTVDSSLGFNRSVGFRAGTSLPFRHFDLAANTRLDLLQIPFAVHDGALFRSDSLELDAGLGRETVRGLLDAIADNAGLATLIFHPNNLEHEEYVELLRFSIEYGRERGAWFGSLRDVERWWRDRDARLAAR